MSLLAGLSLTTKGAQDDPLSSQNCPDFSSWRVLHRAIQIQKRKGPLSPGFDLGYKPLVFLKLG